MSSDESMAEPLRPHAPIQDEHPGYLGDPYDIGRFVNARTDAVDRETLLRMLTAPWTTDNTFMFPTGKDTGANRHFQRGYLLTYPWLAYSAIPEVEGGFCCTCVLFSRRFGGLGAQQLGTLGTRPLNKFKKATNLGGAPEAAVHAQQTLADRSNSNCNGGRHSYHSGIRDRLPGAIKDASCGQRKGIVNSDP